MEKAEIKNEKEAETKNEKEETVQNNDSDLSVRISENSKKEDGPNSNTVASNASQRMSSIVDEESSREKLEDAKDLLLEGVESLTNAITQLNKFEGLSSKNKKI